LKNTTEGGQAFVRLRLCD